MTRRVLTRFQFVYVIDESIHGQIGAQFVIVNFILLATGTRMSDYSHEERLARATVMDYLEGPTDPSPERLTNAFYSSTNLHSVDSEGRLEIVPRDRFIRFTGAGNLPEHTNEILSLEVIEDMAWAKVKFDLPDRQFVDVLTLLRLVEGWKFVSKTYTVIMKNRWGFQVKNNADNEIQRINYFRCLMAGHSRYRR